MKLEATDKTMQRDAKGTNIGLLNKPVPLHAFVSVHCGYFFLISYFSVFKMSALLARRPTQPSSAKTHK